MAYHLHQKIPGTVALLQLQSSLTDTSDYAITPSVERGSAAYESMGGGIVGFRFSGANNLIFPSTDVLRMSGEFTVQFLIQPMSVGFHTHVAAESVSLAGSLAAVPYSLYFDNLGKASYADHSGNAEIGTVSSTLTGPASVGVGAVHHYTYRRVRTGVNGSGVNIYLVEFFDNGNLAASWTETRENVCVGDELVRVGAYTAGGFADCRMASLRILNYARTNAQIKADADFGLADPPNVHAASEYVTNPALPLRPFYYLKITGLPYYFFATIDPTNEKWGAAKWTLPAGYQAVPGMDVPSSTIEQALPNLIGGIASAERVTLSMQDFQVTDTHGTHSFFGRLLAPGRMTSNTSAIIGLLWGDQPAGTGATVIAVRGTGGAFSAQDTFVGGETMGVNSVTGPDGDGVYTLSVNERNKYPCHPNYPPAGSYYVPLDEQGAVLPNSTAIVTQGDPISFINRSAALYIGGLTPDGRPEPEANSLCRLIGHVTGIDYGRDPGKFEFVVESVMGDLKNARVAPQLAHGDLGTQIHLEPEAWRTFTIEIDLNWTNSGVKYPAKSVTTVTVDNGAGNNYGGPIELRDAINRALPKYIRIEPDGVNIFEYYPRCFIDDGNHFGFKFDMFTRDDALQTIKLGFAPNANTLGGGIASQNVSVGLMSALGFVGTEAMRQVQPDTHVSNTTYAAAITATRTYPFVFIPIAESAGGVEIGMLHTNDGSARRFFTDQGDGSGTAFVRYGDGQVGQILSHTPTTITVGQPAARVLGKPWFTQMGGGVFYYAEQGDAATVDQVIRIPPQNVFASAERGLFQLLASKGYAQDGEYNVFPQGVGLGLDGLLDKTSVRQAAFKFTSSFAVDVDAQTLFTDLWNGIAKEQGLFLVWDPATAKIALRQLTLGASALAQTFAFTESNRPTPTDRTQIQVDRTNMRTGWIVRYGWDPIQKKFTAPEITINDSFAILSEQISSRVETIEDRLIPATETSFVTDTVVKALFDRSIFTRYPWLSATRKVNKTGLLISPGQYYPIADATIFNPFTGQLGISLSDGLFVWVTRVQSKLDTGEVTATFLIDQTTDGSLLRPWAPTALLNFAAANNGYDNATGIVSLASWYTQGDHDGVDFVVGDKVALVPRDNATGSPAYVKTGTVSAVAADGTTVTIDAGIGAVSTTVETVMVLQDWGSQTAARKAGANRVSFQGDGNSLQIASSGARLHKWT